MTCWQRVALTKNALLTIVRRKGTKMDKLRLAIIYLLVSGTTPVAKVEAIELVLKEDEVDLSAFH